MVRSKPPNSKFLIRNLNLNPIISNDKRANRGQITKCVEKTLEEMGFTLPKPQVDVQNFGYEFDKDSENVQRYWVIYDVDSKSAKLIQKQRRGITGRIERMNRNKEIEERTKLKKYRGMKHETERKVIKRALGYFVKYGVPGKDKGKVDSITRDKLIITVHCDGKCETVTLLNLFQKYGTVFERASRKLTKQEKEMIMVHVASKKIVVENGENDADIREEVSPESHRQQLGSTVTGIVDSQNKTNHETVPMEIDSPEGQTQKEKSPNPEENSEVSNVFD